MCRGKKRVNTAGREKGMILTEHRWKIWWPETRSRNWLRWQVCLGQSPPGDRGRISFACRYTELDSPTGSWSMPSLCAFEIIPICVTKSDRNCLTKKNNFEIWIRILSCARDFICHDIFKKGISSFVSIIFFDLFKLYHYLH